MNPRLSLPVTRLIGPFVTALVMILATSSIATPANNLDAHDTDDPTVLARLSDLPPPRGVTIPWQPGHFGAFQMGTPEENGVRARRGNLMGWLYLAPHADNAPYAVLLAGCGGSYIGANSLWFKLWARELRDIGVGALALDSLESRGVKNGICHTDTRLWAHRRVDDAYAALDWLANQPGADRRRIIVMGMSNGGRAALLSVSATETIRFRQFAAAIAFYPVCDGLPPHNLLTPALLLFGGADQLVSPAKCERFTTRRRTAVFPLQITIYPEASHLFDVYPRDDNYNLPEVIGSRVAMIDFLRQVLNIAQPDIGQKGPLRP